MKGSTTLNLRQFSEFLSQVFGSAYSFSYYDAEDLAMNRASFRIGEKSIQQDMACTELVRKLRREAPETGEDYKILAGQDKAGRVRPHIFYCREPDGFLSGVFLVSENAGAKANVLAELEKLLNLKTACGAVPASCAAAQPESPSSLPGMVRQIMNELSIEPNAVLTPEEKATLVHELRERGAFNLKGAVPIVAQLLNSSAPTIYRYLSKLDQRPTGTADSLGESVRLL